MGETQRLDLAIRRNRGSRIRQEWISRLRKASSCDLANHGFLELEKTVQLRAAFFARLGEIAPTKRLRWEKNALPRVEHLLAQVGRKAGELTLILFSSVDAFVGAAHLPAAAVLSNFLAVWNVVQEDFCVCTADIETGLCVEFDFYNDNGDYIPNGLYTLSAWGLLGTHIDELKE